MKLNLNLVITLEISFCLIIFSIAETNAKYCDSIDIRNDPKEFEQLRGCTVVDGSVHIILIEKYRNHNFSVYQFPELKVITGYLLVHRVLGLRTLEHLMPNLLVIRGEQLMSHYALAIYEAIDMTDIGLKSLVKIQHGFVLIRNVSMMCFSDTIDWKQLAPQQVVGGWGNLIEVQPAPKYLPHCPTIAACSFCGPSGTCWNAQNCQRFDDGYSNDKKIKCHPECLGGCNGPTAYNCTVCQNFQEDGKCVEKCSETKYTFLGRNECVTNVTCIENNRIPFDGECRKECPPNFSHENPLKRGQISFKTCYPCYTNCLKYCDGYQINSLSESEFYQGCQIINGSLVIEIPSGMADTERLLKRNLGDIEEITEYLKVCRSPAIESLSFFQKLHTIHGRKLYMEKYAVVIVSNQNLQTFSNKRNPLKIARGSLLLYHNSRLCLNNIQNWNNTLDRSPEWFTNDSLNTDLNGYDHSCTARILNSSHYVISDTAVDIIWDTFVAPLDQVVLGYIIYYMAAPDKNLTIAGVDSCLAYGWKSLFVQNASTDNSGLYQKHNITGLNQNTQYAYYIKTKVVMKNEENVTNVKQGQSDICYFRTDISTPTAPLVRTVIKTSDTILFEWLLVEDQEVIEYFYVDIFIQPDEHDFLDPRNYCKHPRNEMKENEDDVVIVEPRKTRSNCQKKATDGCGIDDYKITDYGIFDYGIHDNYNLDSNDQTNTIDIDKLDPCFSQQCENEHKSFMFKREIEKKINENEIGDNVSTNGTIFKRDVVESPYFKHHIGTKRFPGNITNEHITGFQPYTLYTMHFFSCNSKGCSSYFMYNERTSYSESADNIDFDILFDENDFTTIHLEFSEPKMPNGLTVAFHIEKFDVKKSTSEIICIPRKQHYENNRKYTFKKLDNGRYGFRVRSISLALDGNFTDFKYVWIYHSETWLFSLAALGLMLIVMCGGITVLLYKKYRKRVSRPIDIDRQNILENEILPDTLYDDDPFYIGSVY